MKRAKDQFLSMAVLAVLTALFAVTACSSDDGNDADDISPVAEIQYLSMLDSNPAWWYSHYYKNISSIRPRYPLYLSDEEYESINPDTLPQDTAYTTFNELRTFYLADSVVVNSHNYRKLVGGSLEFLGSETHYDSNYPLSGVSARTRSSASNTMYVYIREENGRVYVEKESYLHYLTETDKVGRSGFFNTEDKYGDASYLPYEETADGELVIYDFTMQQGDKFKSVPGYENVWVKETGTVTTADGKERKRLVMSNGLEIVEGIGCICSKGPFFAWLNPYPSNRPVRDEKLGYSIDPVGIGDIESLVWLWPNQTAQ